MATPTMPTDFETCLHLIRRSEIGRASTIATPFGERLICYADQTASGRYISFVEDWLDGVRRYYANTHTLVSSTGRLMTTLREQAREAVARSVNAGADDVVIFAGCGATAALNKLVGMLGLVGPRSGESPQPLPPLVLIGPYEHHSNVLPWVESSADVVEIGETPNGQIDLAELEKRLKEESKRPWIVGAFSAASNVTGILTDVRAISGLLHAHGALAVFDFAASAPYSPIDMHPANDPAAHMDAIALSAHKFPGGPGGSGILVASRKCFRMAIPERPGGGTVSYVASFDRFTVDYVARLDEREEGGTPSVLGDIRAGLAFVVKDRIGAEELIRHETDLARQSIGRLVRHPKIQWLGSRDLPRLPILSFNIQGLHHVFVTALLDQLFGIQTRSGCACAGPYGHRLLGVGPDRSEAFRRWILKGVLGIKPGWVRVTLPSYASKEDIEFILSAIEFVADHGEELLPAYELDWGEGTWTHRDGAQPSLPTRLSFESLLADLPSAEADISEQELEQARARYFSEARQAAATWSDKVAAVPVRLNPGFGDPEVDSLVWFRYVHATHKVCCSSCACCGAGAR